MRVDDWKVHFHIKEDWFFGQARTPTMV